MRLLHDQPSGSIGSVVTQGPSGFTESTKGRADRNPRPPTRHLHSERVQRCLSAETMWIYRMLSRSKVTGVPTIKERRLGSRSSLAAIALLIAGCGSLPSAQIPRDQAASPTRTSPPLTSPQPSGTWQVYTDSRYHFTVAYPATFTFEPQHGLSGTGLLMTYRTVDPTYLNTYPPGQIEIAIYSQDASNVADWITKHSGPPASSDPNRYWSPVSNESAVTVAGRSGESFDWIPDMHDKTVHATAILLETSYVLVIQWWATDPTYAPMLASYYHHMLGDLQA